MEQAIKEAANNFTNFFFFIILKSDIGTAQALFKELKTV